ncbi:MAG: hypothetical protein J2O48_02990 [Solirubrobacterales bacterium]|nr:hypothetical protein [Solirubrobacterales bacterium]
MWIALLLSACGSDKPKQVSAGDYVTGLCNAVKVFARDLDTRSSTLVAAGKLPPARARPELVSYLQATGKDAHTAAGSLRALGTPSVPGGQSFASGLVTGFDQLGIRLDHSAALARKLPTGAGYHSAATRLDQSLRSAMGSLASSETSSIKSGPLAAAARKATACR